VKAKQGVVIGVAVLVLAASGGVVFYTQHKPAAKAPVQTQLPVAPAAPTAVQQAAPPPATLSPPVAPAECMLPGPPPVPPDGATATDADMKLGHDAIQHFVVQLEAFQACRNAQIDHAPAGTTDARKQIWLQEGNAAVDDAHALADAFSAQLKIFKARTK
jgi:hypothetical protein